MKSNIYNQVTDALIKQLESGIIPWQKPWTHGSFMGCVSHSNGRAYSLLNQWLLNGRAGEWLTYNQVQAEGGRIKKGEKASMVVFWAFIDKIETNAETGEQKVVGKYPILKGYNVWHIDQTEGITPKYDNKAVTYTHTPIERAEEVITNYVAREGLKLEIVDSDRACYSPVFDRVRVPEMQQFKVQEEYYSTLFHELTHSTGHPTRLNREGVADIHFFGDELYSKEELVAEMGSAFMMQSLGIECEKAFRNSAAYIQGWLRALKNDKKLIVSAAAKAEAAVEYLLHGKE